MLIGDFDGSVAEQGSAVEPLRTRTLRPTKKNQALVARGMMILLAQGQGEGTVGCSRSLPNEDIRSRAYIVPAYIDNVYSDHNEMYDVNAMRLFFLRALVSTCSKRGVFSTA